MWHFGKKANQIMLVYQNLYIWHFPKYLAFSNFRVGNKPSIKEEEEIPALSFLYYKYILYFLQPPLQFAQLPNIYCFFPICHHTWWKCQLFRKFYVPTHRWFYIVICYDFFLWKFLYLFYNGAVSANTRYGAHWKLL